MKKLETLGEIMKDIGDYDPPCLAENMRGVGRCKYEEVCEFIETCPLTEED